MLIHRINEQRKMAGGGASAYNFGGSSKSDSSTKTTSQTTNWTDYNDQRVVGQDEAIGLSGNGSTVNRTTSNLTSFIDTSNRSTNFSDTSNRSTNFSDSSTTDNRNQSKSTTTFTDNSDRSVRITTTDHGAVAAGLGLGTKALDMAGKAVSDAFNSATLQTESGLKATMAAFDLAKSSGANSMASSAAVLGFASDTIGEARAAFQEADDNGQKTIAVYAILAVAAVGVALALRR